MIRARDAIRTARGLLGTPYSEMDCINLMKRVIRTAPGGVPGYTTAGTNTLWKSYEASKKYRDLTWRQEGLSAAAETSSVSPSASHLPQRGRLDAQAGMLAFKRSGEDVHHVGLVTDEGTVIHSSSVKGKVVETALDCSWHLLAVHRYIEVSGEEQSPSPTGGTDMESYKAVVRLENENSTLNVRNEPGTGGDIIGRLGHGAVVTVQAEFDNGWKYIAYGESGVGYVSGAYLAQMDEAPAQTENIITVSGEVTIIDDAGNTFRPVGGWRVMLGSVD